jgi:hypothetical protein
MPASRNSARRSGAGWYQSNHQRAKPLYDFTCQLATLAPPMHAALRSVHGNRDATNQFIQRLRIAPAVLHDPDNSVGLLSPRPA